MEAAPSDTSYADQWALPQVGWDQLYGTVGIAGSATVAVLDTGVDAAHQDLDGVLLPGTSILDGSNGLSDPNGHGTWMAGIVAAETDNAFGVAGTAYAGVSILPVTVLGADGTGQDSDIIAGVVYAADAGADVILMSFSNPGFSPALQAAIDYAWNSGAVLVAATGNDGSGTATFPAGDRGVIGVTSTDSLDTLAVGANYGPAAFMAAPGVDIATTSSGGGVASISGTSAAAAAVAGAAALLSANEPLLSNGVIVSRLARTADPAGDPAQTGNGRLNLARAMADASTDSVQPAGAAPVGLGVRSLVLTSRRARWTPLPITLYDDTCTTPQSSFAVGETICLKTTVNVNGNGQDGDLVVSWYNNGLATGLPAQSTHFGDLDDGDEVEDTFTPSAAGSYSVETCKTSNTGNCSGNVAGQGNTLDQVLNISVQQTLSINDVTAAEGTTPAGTTPFVFTVTRSGTTGISTVAFATAAGSATGGLSCATAGVDYQTAGGVLTFGNGVATQTITVQVCREHRRRGRRDIQSSNLSAPTTPPSPTARAWARSDDDVSLRDRRRDPQRGQCRHHRFTFTVSLTGAAAGRPLRRTMPRPTARPTRRATTTGDHGHD